MGDPVESFFLRALFLESFIGYPFGVLLEPLQSEFKVTKLAFRIRFTYR